MPLVVCLDASKETIVRHPVVVKEVLKKPIVLDSAQQAFSVPQAALYLGISAWQVRMNIWQGRLPAKKVGKSLVIARTDADKFLADLPVVEPSAAPWLTARQKGGAA